MEKLYYTWNDPNKDCAVLTREMALEDFKSDVIIGPAEEHILV